MTNPQTIRQIEKALSAITMIWDESGVFGEAPESSHIYMTGKNEAKQQVLALIEQHELQARMDELNRQIEFESGENGRLATLNQQRANLKKVMKGEK